MSRREQIKMDEAEVGDFLAAQRIVICATNGPDGWPHLMPLWYLLREGDLWAWTYAKSQKVRNLERDDRVTLQVESGHEYHELRGVMIRGRCRLHRDPDIVAGVGWDLAARYGGENVAVGPEAGEVFARQAAKRVALEFVVQSTATWDHRKLAGVY